MFKYLLMSIVIVPVLLGVKAANSQRGIRVLVIGWALFSLLWVGMLFFLRLKWVE